MTTDTDAMISAEGIFVSCSRGATRVWEFHPDDVTSVGIYREDGENHEVIVTVNKDFDIPEGTIGLRELNERLFKDLKAKFSIDANPIPSGVILWPAHLAGSPLWEFYVLGEDGLASYVSPNTPNASRNLCRAVRREMARSAKLRLPEGFPKSLVDRGFGYHGDISWNKEDAIAAAEWFHENGAATVDAEIWLVQGVFVQPYIETTAGTAVHHFWTTTHPLETWEAFKSRSLNETVDFIRQFRLPTDATGFSKQVRFCLSWVWREWLEENEFRFPRQE
jgi:hypothetical protein